jgi:ribosomal protein S18 acetylase RimI-like enzyme
MEFSIRPYHPIDFTALGRICLLTGDNGKDASLLYNDPDLLGLYYTAPYLVLEPDLCFVLLYQHQPCGYMLGTPDSANFYIRCEREWFPLLRQRYPLLNSNDPSPDAQIVRAIHTGHCINAELSAYPAHFHIDVLPIAQGHGWGRRLIEAFLQQLREQGVPGVHLGVGKANWRAVRFYERQGFQPLMDVGEAWIYGMRL